MCESGAFAFRKGDITLEKCDGIGKSMTSFALNTIRNTAEYILVLLTILECNSLYYFYAGREASNEKILRLGLLATAFFLLVFRYLETKDEKSLIKLLPTLGGMYVLMGAFLVLNVMRKTDLTASYFILFLFFLPVVTVLFYLDRIEGKPFNLLYKYADIVAVYAFLAVIIYLFSVFFGGKMPSTDVLTYWSNKGTLKTYTDYFGIVAVSTDKIFSLGGFEFCKMYGIFPEPPMAMIPLITALYAEIFLKKNKSGLVSVVFISLAVLFTGSTLGYMLLVLAFALHALGKLPEKWRVFSYVALVVAVCAVVAVLFAVKKKNDYSSLSAHLEDYVLCFKAFLKSPFIGNAFGNDYPILELMSAERFEHNPGLSNSIAVVLAQGGILLEIICFLPFVRGLAAVFSKDAETRREGFFFVGITALFVVTIFTYRFFLFFLMGFGYALMPFKLSTEPKRVFTEKISPGKLVEYAFGALFLLSVIFSFGGIWKVFFTFFKSNSLLLSQSAWNLVFSLIFVIGAVMMISEAVNAKSKVYASLTALMLAVGAVLIALRPQIVTNAKSFCDVMQKSGYSKLFVIFINILMLACVYAFVWCVFALKKKEKLYSIIFAVFPIAFCILVSRVITGNAGYYTEQVEKDIEVMSIVVENASGKVYSDTLPYVYAEKFPSISVSSKSGGEFAVLDNASVLMADDYREMFEEGFSCVSVCDNRALYTNDESVINALKENGYTVNNHYPNSLSIDLSSLASENGLSLNDDNYIALDGETAQITHGGETSLKDGTYLVTFSLASDEKSEVTVSALRYGEVLKTKTSTADKYSKYNNLSVSLKIKAKDLDDLQFAVVSEGKAVLKKISYKQITNYDKVNYRDEYNRVIKTEYRKNGELYTSDKGYAVIETEYDKKGEAVSKKYFDALGNEVHPTEN